MCLYTKVNVELSLPLHASHSLSYIHPHFLPLHLSIDHPYLTHGESIENTVL